MSFIRRAGEQPVEHKKAFGGAGEVENHKILTGPEEMHGKGRLFNHTFVQPGCEIGWHIHQGDGETYYILRGRGQYSYNGELTEVGPGDVTYVSAGEGHSLKNIGDEPLEMIALVLYN